MRVVEKLSERAESIAEEAMVSAWNRMIDGASESEGLLGLHLV